MDSNVLAGSRIKSLWEIESYCKNSDICAAAQELRPWLAELTDTVARFVAGEEDLRLPEESVVFNDIEKKIIHTFKPHHRAIHFLHALALVVTRGNEQGIFNICPPRLPSLVIPEKSPFQSETKDQIALARQLRNLVWTTQIDPDKEPEKFMGQILVSAALNGALAYSRHLAALYNAAQGPFQVIDVGRGKKYSFYEFCILYTSQQVPELRRWFIDPFTELLLLRLSPVAFVIEENEKKAGTKAWRCMIRFLLHVGIKSSSMPKSLQQFLEIANAWNWFRLPGFLCSLTSRDIVPHSLKTHVWRRFFGLMNSTYENEVPLSTIEESSSPTEQELEDTDVDIDGPEEEEPFVEFTWIKDLRALIKGLDRKEIAKKLREVAACLDDSFSMKVIGTRWICFMMAYRSSSGKFYSLAAIRRFAGHILSRVAGMVDDTDITLLEGEGLVEIYQQLLTDVHSDSYRYKIACGLREFHHFLIEKYHISPVNYREVLGIGSKASRVDANILSIDEYYKSLECLKGMTAQLDPHTNLIDVAQIIFFLAFRCGLRRNEALKLMASDLHEHPPVILLIRKNDFRSLKTQSSTRSLNLSLLLSHEELEKLLSFKLLREKEMRDDPNDPGYLFCIPKMSYSFVPEERVYDAIRDAMHMATGDRTLRFHHLRHSMASWRALSLMLADIGIYDDPFPMHPLTTKFLRSANEFKTVLYSRNEPTRKHLLTLASMLGHSAPDISCTSYIHLFDLALKIAIESSTDQCDRSLLIMASMVPRSSAQRIFKDGGVAALLDGARKRAHVDRFTCNMVVDSPRPLLDERDEILPQEVRMMERVWGSI